MNTDGSRIQTVVRDIRNVRQHIALARQIGPDEQREAIDAALDDLEEARDRLLNAARQPEGRKAPTSGERASSIVDALERVAKSRRPMTFPVDTLASLVVQHADASMQEHWLAEPDEAVIGFVGYNDEVTDELRRRGVLAWYSSIDKLTRLVHVDWLRDRSEIHAWVHGDGPAGRACRFCGIEESADNEQLVNRDAEGGYHAFLHEQCRPYWSRWQGVAAQVDRERASASATG